MAPVSVVTGVRRVCASCLERCSSCFAQTSSHELLHTSHVSRARVDVSVLKPVSKTCSWYLA
ncbi:hypothetical protein K458DRAFT_165893 [Lentithecium fluviatile CBS 122367]|uniref:Uncharacterized protein n=1 Tax=Lentithecium fluviatile CBS 122367 TaxID=1168545 RepID=A0A6G1IFE4_9PLEO|nr:hypothetical protein K458DRAFT_165893 [Lentithecium fluviatile CBS 122367]